MARLPRYFVPGVPLHLIQHRNNRQVIFADDADFGNFSDWLLDAVHREWRSTPTSTPRADGAKGRVRQTPVSR